MGDVVSFKGDENTPRGAAEHLLKNIKDSDLTMCALVVQENGEVAITASPMSTERMYYLGGILQEFALDYNK